MMDNTVCISQSSVHDVPKHLERFTRCGESANPSFASAKSRWQGRNRPDVRRETLRKMFPMTLLRRGVLSSNNAFQVRLSERIMTDAQKQIHFEVRTRHVERILSSPFSYKVCDQCKSISLTTARLCPICHAYRWDSSAETVIETAKHIGKSPFPYSAGVVPRL